MKRTNFKDFNTNNFLIKINFDTKGNKFLWPGGLARWTWQHMGHLLKI